MTTRIRSRLLLAASTCALLLALAIPASAANVILVNFDPPGTGLNDPTPATPVGGNPGLTIGDQRINAYLFAAQIWDNILDSNVPIFVGARFLPLPCSPTGGVLGSAQPTFAFVNFPGTGFLNTWYISAEADALSGVDLAPGFIDIISNFNSDIDDDPNCLTGRSWYYGFDNNQGPNGIDFLTVVLHEINHGLGHLDLVSGSTGALFFGLPDIYSKFMLDLELNATWDSLTDAERLTSQVNTLRLVWNGSNVTADAASFLGSKPLVQVDEPESLGDFEAQPATFGPAFPGGDDDDDSDSDSDSDGGVSGEIVLVDDGVGVGTDACEAITNDVDGDIALIDRGGCAFTVKVANAEAAGAIAAIIANNQPKGLPSMGGSDPSIGIVSAGISLAAGNALKDALAEDDDDSDSDSDGEVELAFGFSAAELAGTSDGFVRLFAPDPFQGGSSKAHWDPTAEPSLTMEPSITPDLQTAISLDLSPSLLLDIGWPLLP